jgi:hypothetical protein
MMSSITSVLPAGLIGVPRVSAHQLPRIRVTFTHGINLLL